MVLWSVQHQRKSGSCWFVQVCSIHRLYNNREEDRKSRYLSKIAQKGNAYEVTQNGTKLIREMVVKVLAGQTKIKDFIAQRHHYKSGQ